MRAADILVKEHDEILNVVAAASKEASRIAKTGKVDTQLIGEMVDFFQQFVDKCHHGKEEADFFPLLEARGISRFMGPVGCMLTEHDIGRKEVRAIKRALDAHKKGRANAAAQLARHLAAYARLLAAHIYKENEILFKLADDVLTPQDQSDLLRNFEVTEQQNLGDVKLKRYRTWVKKLVDT